MTRRFMLMAIGSCSFFTPAKAAMLFRGGGGIPAVEDPILWDDGSNICWDDNSNIDWDS